MRDSVTGPARETAVGRAGAVVWRPVRFVLATAADRLAVGVLVLAGAYVYYVDLGGFNLQSWDEGLYATMARNVLRGGPWIVPEVNYAAGGAVVVDMPFLQKPPGAFWLEAASMAVFGVTEFAARVPSATFAVATGVLAYVVGRDVFDRRAGFVAGLVWLTTPSVFAGVNGGRHGGTDPAMVFLGTVFVYLVWKGVVDDRRYLAYAGLPAAGAVLVKGFAAGIFVLVVAPLAAYDLLARRRLLSLDAAVGAAVTFGLVFPWAAAAWASYGDVFVYEIFVEHVLARAAGGHGHQSPGTFAFMQFPYFRRLPVFYDPWLFFLGPAAVVAGVAARRRPDRPGGHGTRRDTAFLAWWTAVVPVFFAFTGNHGWYLLPMYVPGGVLVGRLVSLARRETASRLSHFDRRLAVLGLAAGGALTLAFSSRVGLWPPVAYRLPGNVPGGVGFVIVLGVALAVLAWESRLTAQVTHQFPDVDATTLRSAAFVVLAACFVAATAAPADVGGHGIYVQQKGLGTLADQQLPPDATVHVPEGTTRADAFHSLVFYADRTFRPVETATVRSSDRVDYLFARAGTVTSLDRDIAVIGTVRWKGRNYVLAEVDPPADRPAASRGRA